jgi:CubicO group peptidase (beta-lactamase class C family)
MKSLNGLARATLVCLLTTYSATAKPVVIGGDSPPRLPRNGPDQPSSTPPDNVQRGERVLGGAGRGRVAERVTEAEAIAALAEELERQTAADMFAGAVMVSRNGETIFATAKGYADIERQIPNDVDTAFGIGSMGKMFTGTAVLQLVQAGRINLDDPLSAYLPDYPNEAMATATIHQLLTHTAGAGNIFGPDEIELFNANRENLREPEDFIALFGERPPGFAPGSRWEYSNYGFILLGRIIEVVSGESYFDYVRKHIFQPAGMNSTDNYPVGELPPKTAIGYTRVPPGERLSGRHADEPLPPLRPNTETLPYRGGPAGGGYSTVGDLIRFATALREHKLLDQRHTELLVAGKVASMGSSKYAYGFGDDLSQDGVRTVGHNGGAPGIYGQLTIFPVSGYAVAVLANRDPQGAIGVIQSVTTRLPAK